MRSLQNPWKVGKSVSFEGSWSPGSRLEAKRGRWEPPPTVTEWREATNGADSVGDRARLEGETLPYRCSGFCGPPAT